MSTDKAAPGQDAPTLNGQLTQVALATIASTAGFWAWMSIAPLQKTYATSMGLTEGQISVIAAVMMTMAAIVWFFMKESPAWARSQHPLVPRIKGALKLPITWQMSFLYAVVFGGFVAFSTFLPKYLTTIYPDQVDQIGAGTRMGTFVIAAVLARPIGGILADRLGPKLIA